jgi:TfoX/Sxy family transcriptional regulator of competence genes
MAQDDQLAIRVRRALSGVKDVQEKRMFGSTGFLVNGKLCVSARESKIMCRVDPALQRDLLARRGCTAMKMKGREYNGYVLVDSGALQTEKDLKFWVGLALDFNSTIGGDGT